MCNNKKETILLSHHVVVQVWAALTSSWSWSCKTELRHSVTDLYEAISLRPVEEDVAREHGRDAGNLVSVNSLIN